MVKLGSNPFPVWWAAAAGRRGCACVDGWTDGSIDRSMQREGESASENERKREEERKRVCVRERKSGMDGVIDR